jgi:hypothetical protein
MRGGREQGARRSVYGHDSNIKVGTGERRGRKGPGSVKFETSAMAVGTYHGFLLLHKLLQLASC